MSNVYFIPLADAGDAEISSAAAKLLEHILEAENIPLSECIPLKVHCGEAGNRTFIRPECFNGVIDILEKRNTRSCFIETSVLYGGKRGNKAAHTRLAADHGFTRIPFTVADGENLDDAAGGAAGDDGSGQLDGGSRGRGSGLREAGGDRRL